MVALFARLKWTLTTGRLRAAPARGKVAVGIGLAVGLLASLVVGLTFVGLRTRPEVAVPAVGAFFTAQLLAWMLAPLIAFGVDETVDPRRFALLPLRPAVLQRGLLVSSLIGYLPLFNVVALLGAAIGLSSSWSVLPVALVVCAAQLVTCVTFSRAASASMAALMSSRRGRDLGMAVGILVVVAYVGGSILLNAGRGGDPSSALAAVQRTARAVLWGPPGSWAVIPGALTGGETIRLIVAVGTAASFLVLGWWWWSAALRRSLVTAPSTTSASSPARSGDLGSAVATGVTGTARLVAARDLRLAWRDPIRRLPWVLVVLFAVAWPFIVHGEASIFAVVLGAMMAGAQTANHLGVEGSGIWLHLVAYADPVRARGEMLGHAMASIGPGAVILAVALAVQAAARGHAELLPAAVGVCLCALLGAVGAACWLSAALPYAMPQSRTSVFVSSIAGQKGRAAGATFAVLGIAAATTVPAGVAAVLAVTKDPVWGWLGVLAVPVCAVPVFVALAMRGARTYLRRGPEILAIVSIGDRS